MGLLDDDQEYIDGIQPTQETLQNMTLIEIEKLLQRNGKSLRNFSSMPYPSSIGLNLSENPLIINKMSHDMSALDSEHVVLIGKMFLWKTLSADLRSKGEIVLNVASSGIEALLLPGGRTAHSRISIPINPHDESFCTILPNNNLAGLIRRSKLIIWDEDPIVNRINVETLDRSLRDVCGTTEQIVRASLNSSYLWDHVTVLKLTVNMRLSNVYSGHSDEQNRKNLEDIRNFADWLLNIGNGTVNPTEDGIQKSKCLKMSLNIICQSDRDSHFNSELYTTDYLNNINVGGLPKHDLKLKDGVPIMLLRNVDQAGGLCNGTRLQIIELCDKTIKAKILTGTHVGTITPIPRMLIVPSDKRIPFRFQRRQYPLSLKNGFRNSSGGLDHVCTDWLKGNGSSCTV
ncbi:uncharacterized protein [Rutidosis leptorrhynchoides]|uniref:uncharacterized protein n=1 Tax=Rutidosis leptorrhynchoides TaxID=125765 RepID=UPI003A9A151E